jgi:hypothetical protein
LNPGQAVTYVTGGLPTTTQVFWGMLNYNSTGEFVSLYEAINLFNSAANYLASEAGPSDFGIYNYSTSPGTYLPFNNANSEFTTLAFVNPDAQIDAQTGTSGVYTAEIPSLQITFIDSAGNVIGNPVIYTVPTGTQTNVIIANTWPQTAGLAGTMYIVPYSTGCTTACPEFSDITILALQSKSTQNGAGFSHTNAFVPLLTIGDYTN